MAINWTNKQTRKLTVEGCITFEVFWLEVSSTDSCMFSYDKVLASNCRYPLCSNHLVRWELVATSSVASGHAAVSHVRANFHVRNNYQKNTFATDTKTKLLQQRVDYYSNVRTSAMPTYSLPPQTYMYRHLVNGYLRWYSTEWLILFASMSKVFK